MRRSTPDELIGQAGVEPSADNLVYARSFLLRARRSKWVGVGCGIIAGVGPLTGDHHHSLVVPRLLAGYLFGLMLSELLPPRIPRGDVKRASLRARAVSDFVPRAAVVAPWLVLLPVLATPLLDIGFHPRGVTRSHGVQSDCFGVAYWPQASTLMAIAALAAAGLTLLVIASRRATHRPQPAENMAALRLDRALRAQSVRESVAAAAAMGLMLLGLVGQYVNDGIHSYVCNRPLTGQATGNVYSWGDAVAPWLQDVSLALMILAIPVWMIFRRLPTPSRDEPVA